MRLARLALLLLLAACTLRSVAQTPSSPRPIVENPTLSPEYPGGQQALNAYLEASLRYPLEAYRAHVNGKVRVRFIVDEAGLVQAPVVLKGLGFGCDEEALRLVQALTAQTAFQPARDANGQAVATYEKATVKFDLQRYVPGTSSLKRNDQINLPLSIATGVTITKRVTTPKAPATTPLAGAGTLAAQYPGGLSELFVFISKKTRYPKAARRADVEGRVVVSVLVDEQGRATAPTVVESLGYDCDAEALRVVQCIPLRFNPAQNNNGQLVASRYEIPVFFPRMKLSKYRRSKGHGGWQILERMAQPGYGF